MQSFLLAIIVFASFLSGCELLENTRETKEPKVTLSERDKEAVSAAEDIVIESEEISDALLKLIDQQIEASGIFVSEYAKSVENDFEYDSTAFNTVIMNNQTTINELILKVESLSEDYSNIKEPKAEQAVLVYDAVGVYLGKLEACLSDLLGVVTLYLDQTEATLPIYNFDDTAYGDDVYLMMEDLYAAIDQTILNFKAIDSCPEYMKETLNIYIRKMAVYSTMLEEWYDGLLLYDPLRISSGNQLLMRQNVDVIQFEVQLFELFDLQYIKVGERLEGNILTLKEEIFENAETLSKSSKTLPEVQFSYLTELPEVGVDYEYAQTIYPSLYSSMDSIVNLTATTDHGTVNVMMTVEIPGLTQKYQQKIAINEQVTKLLIKPPLLTENLDLESSKDAQLRITIEDLDNDRSVLEDTKTIALMSVYDFMLHDDEFGVTSRDNVLAWMTPESESILTLRRNAISWIDTWSEGQINSLIGYQDYGLFEDPALNTYVQILAIQGAISDYGVRYNMGAFSMSEGINQRVLLPDKVLSSGSGICIETAILFASVIQSAEMHAMIIFLPGHAQVAVETGYRSGEYYLVETTLLPFLGGDEELDSLITYKTAEEWELYLADPWGDGSGGAYVVDCDLVQVLGFKAIGYK
jgi:hypothetical protein